MGLLQRIAADEETKWQSLSEVFDNDRLVARIELVKDGTFYETADGR